MNNKKIENFKQIGVLVKIEDIALDLSTVITERTNGWYQLKILYAGKFHTVARDRELADIRRQAEILHRWNLFAYALANALSKGEEEDDYSDNGEDTSREDFVYDRESH